MPVTVNTSLGNITTDPIRNFKFHVDITKRELDPRTRRATTRTIASLGFMTFSGISQATEVIPYRQGGYNTSPQKLPGQTNFGDITLSRGVLLGTDQAWRWTKQLFTVMQGTGTGSPGEDFRAIVDVKVLDHPVTDTTRTPIKLWVKFYNAWLSSYALSDLDAGGNGFMVEQMTLVHEGFDIAFATSAAGSDAADPSRARVTTARPTTVRRAA